MNRIASSLVTVVLATAAFGGGKDQAPAEPVYDVKTEVQIDAAVSGVKEVSTGALKGVFLSVKSKSETMEIYLGPADFVKMFDVKFKNGDEVVVTGSKIKFEERDVVLAREVEIGKIILRLRDQKGTPNWLWLKQIPTGL